MMKIKIQIMTLALVPYIAFADQASLIVDSPVRYRASQFRFTSDRYYEEETETVYEQEQQERESEAKKDLATAVKTFGQKFSHHSDYATKFEKKITATSEAGVTAGVPIGKATAKDETSISVSAETSVDLQNEFKRSLSNEEQKAFDRILTKAQKDRIAKRTTAKDQGYFIRFLLSFYNTTTNRINYKKSEGGLTVRIFINEKLPFEVTWKTDDFSIEPRKDKSIVVSGEIKDNKVQQEILYWWHQPKVNFDGVFRAEIDGVHFSTSSGYDVSIGASNCEKTRINILMDEMSSSPKFQEAVMPLIAS